jgi:hypothetical protein
MLKSELRNTFVKEAFLLIQIEAFFPACISVLCGCLGVFYIML